jgi:hypothetical protein
LKAQKKNSKKKVLQQTTGVSDKKKDRDDRASSRASKSGVKSEGDAANLKTEAPEKVRVSAGKQPDQEEQKVEANDQPGLLKAMVPEKDDPANDGGRKTSAVPALQPEAGGGLPERAAAAVKQMSKLKQFKMAEFLQNP